MNIIRSKPTLLSFITLTVLILILSGCGDDKSPTGSNETYMIAVSTESDSTNVDLADYQIVTIEGEDAVKLSGLVDTEIYTEPNNYVYRLIGSDGFYANMKGSPDNIYDHLKSGYIVLSTMWVTFDTSLGLINRYNIDDVAELKILRKIDFITPADSLIQYVVDDLPHVTFQDSLDAVALTEFLPLEVLSSSLLYMYDLVASDEYTASLTYEEFQAGYYVISEDRVLYTNPDITGAKKVRMLNRIVARNP
ncbi:hypothetical protein ACFL50_06270 [Candidatus Latescibacterota bacterium]